MKTCLDFEVEELTTHVLECVDKLLRSFIDCKSNDTMNQKCQAVSTCGFGNRFSNSWPQVPNEQVSTENQEHRRVPTGNG